MATEEIHLNPHLEQHGYEVIETDLGEYIIQLAGETPSHIIAPAIHKTRQQIAALLHEQLGTPYTEVIPEMTQIARRALREQFLRADMGITGVNFAIAETGSIVLVTNEGNGRLSSTMPRVHVALMGMEKVIPRLADLAVMLKVLTNSATGQKISSYVTVLTGPRRAHDLDGPEELHVRGLLERLSDLSEHRWPRLWLGLPRSDWRRTDADVHRPGYRAAPAPCQHALRRLP